MPEEGKHILKYSPGDESIKVQFIIHADLKCLLKKEQSCQKNPKNFYTQKFFIRGRKLNISLVFITKSYIQKMLD